MVRTDEVDQLDREIGRAPSGPAEAHTEVLERALAAFQHDAQAAKYPDLHELHSELAETYDRFGRVEDVLRHADVLDEQGASVPHAVYCQRMERRLRELREADAVRLSIAPLRARALRRWFAEYESEEDDPAQLRAQYAADLGRDPSRTISWPPGRNEPCWCGSGRTYKKCCSSPGGGAPR